MTDPMLGVFFAVLAMLSWGVGDFLIQRSARYFGDWAVLFYIEVFSTFLLWPFVSNQVLALGVGDWIFLLSLGVVILGAALLDLEALRVGKISVVEPINAFEVGVTGALSVFLLREPISSLQGFLLTLLLLGMILVSIKNFNHLRNSRLERGVLLALGATILMGIVNFLFGVGSRATNPLVVNWVTGLFLSVATMAYLVYKKQLGGVLGGLKRHSRLILSMSFIDNTAWIAYSYATLYMPIAIATALSESYIALAAGIGVFVGREKLLRHQWVGFAFVLIAAVWLSATLD